MKGKRLALYTCIIMIVTSVATYSLTYIANAFIYGFVPNASSFGGAVSMNTTLGKLKEIQHLIDAYYYEDYDKELMFDGALGGAVMSLDDPYSGYMNDEMYEQFNEQISGQYCGIGVTVSMDPSDGSILVISTFEGTPANEAGLTTGDKIIAINGKSVPKDLDIAVGKIKGEEHTTVKLTILKKDSGKTEEKEIARKNITIDTLTSEVIEGDIGYIELTSFDNSTLDEFNNELEGVIAKGAKSIILDLRGNPGGLVNAAELVCDTLLPKCDITYLEYKSGKREYLRSEESSYDGKVVVLVDGGSASASEIVAGALRDNDRAKIVGTSTFGKGLVQNLYPLQGGGYVKLTIARYFTPNGEDINKKGITPDYVVEQPADSDVDLQLKKAIELIRE
ncbi:MAG: S41 family peptidase [Eubacteriales bacterium]|nr:S41 family peptidase [Eubacteriales bacterium]